RSRVRLLTEEVQDYYGNFRLTSDLIELRNLVQVSGLIVECALRRRESRGLHYSLDCPPAAPDSPGEDTVLSLQDFPVSSRKAASSSTGTPSSRALSSLLPGSAPTTT